MNKKSCFIIAEIGINHNGDMDITKKLIDMAKSAGCDAVKFQKRTLEIVYTQELLDSFRESPWGKTQRAQKEGLEFGKIEYDEIDTYCKQVGIEWFASAWDIPSQYFLKPYNLKYNKIASAMLTHSEFLEEVAAEKKMTFVSTGMSSYADIDTAVAIFKKHNCPITLMHTVSTYPSKEEELNLLMIKTLSERYDVPVGYSGHESSVSPSVVAVMLGAVAIERHITLDRAMYGSDQAASLEKDGLERLIGMIRKIPVVLGDGVKKFDEREQSIAKKLRYFEEESPVLRIVNA
ncbi:MAG: N-acetylneuraminate synthase family protein [Alphaproteobacteria bacterium]|nr:N-acetylneuraminate synthase family protein [Alphaproteobacteria bacterium]